jgi:hypothetical protein
MTAVADLVFADEAFDAQTGTLAWEGFGRWPTAPPSSPPRNRSPRCARRRRGGRSVRVHRRLADRRRPRRRRNLARRLEPPSCPLPALISDCRRWPPSSGPTPPGNDHHPRSPRPARRAPPHASATTSALLLRDVRHGPGATLGSREVLRVLMIEEVAGRDRANRTARGVLRGCRPGKRSTPARDRLVHPPAHPDSAAHLGMGWPSREPGDLRATRGPESPFCEALATPSSTPAFALAGSASRRSPPCRGPARRHHHPSREPDLPGRAHRHR